MERGSGMPVAHATEPCFAPDKTCCSGVPWGCREMAQVSGLLPPLWGHPHGDCPAMYSWLLCTWGSELVTLSSALKDRS